MTSPIFKFLDTKRKTFSSLGVYLALAFGIYYFVIIKTANDIKTLRDDIITQKINIEKNIAREKNMSELSDEVKKIEPQIDKFSQIFINQNRELEFITQLESIANKNNVKQSLNLAPFDPSSNENKNFYAKIPISIEASGAFEDIINYIAEIEYLKYYININKIDINSSYAKNTQKINLGIPDTQITKNLTISISATTYWK